jgi:branched-chain amino acid transport system ATP-binding protein
MAEPYQLHAEKLTIRFGGLTAVDGVDFTLSPGEIVGIIGPNGAGKTTLINLLAGIYYPTSGRVIFNDEDISTLPAHQRARLGIGRTFQLIHPLEDLSLIENVMNGYLFAQRMSLRQARDAAANLCSMIGLSDLQRPVSRLNILETKQMEIAKALATGPKVLFLDEIMAGLNSTETIAAIQTVKRIATEQNLGIGVVEHVMGVIRQLTERVIVLDGGRIIASGPYSEVSRNPQVVTAYLGEAHNAED